MNSDRGSATVLAVTLAAVLCTAGAVAMVIVESTSRHSRLGHAADAAALAAARTPGNPDCPFAADIAASYSVQLDSCATDGLDVVVRVSCDAGYLLGRAATLAGQSAPRMVVVARAGP